MEQNISTREKLIKEKSIQKDKIEPVEELNVPFQIPQNWKWCRLIDLCSHVTDIEHRMPKAVTKGIKFISAKDLMDDGTINLSQDVKEISEEDYEKLSKRIQPQRGDIIFSRIGTIGKSRIVDTDERFLVSYSCCTIRPLTIDRKYLNYYLDSAIVLEQAIKDTKGIGVPDLGIKVIKHFFVPLPPLEEQKRIVKKVDELMALVDSLEKAQTEKAEVRSRLSKASFSALANAQNASEFADNWQRLSRNFAELVKTQDDVQTLRQTILQLAVQGKLTEQRAEDGDARKELEGIEQKRQSLITSGIIKSNKKVESIEADLPQAYPETWEWRNLGYLIKLMDAGWSPACKTNPSKDMNTWGVLKTTSVQPLNYLEYENKELPQNLEPKPQYEVNTGDLLITRAGPKNRVGICCLVKHTREKLMISDKIIRFHLISDDLFPEYIELALNEGYSKEYLENQKTGMAESQMNISQQKLMFTPIAIPPLAEQKRIVAIVDSLMAICDRLEGLLAQQESTAERLVGAVVQGLAA